MMGLKFVTYKMLLSQELVELEVKAEMDAAVAHQRCERAATAAAEAAAAVAAAAVSATAVSDKKRKIAFRIKAKNDLESFAFNMKSTVEDERLKDKITEFDLRVILDIYQEIIGWLDGNQMATKEEFEHKLKDAEEICNPIITKLYQTVGVVPPGCLGHGDQRQTALNPDDVASGSGLAKVALPGPCTSEQADFEGDSTIKEPSKKKMKPST